MKSFLIWALAFACVPAAFASSVPTCLNKQGNPIEVPNNDQVLSWKQTTPNQYLDRAYVRGTLVGIYNAPMGHLHLDVFIGHKGGAGKVNDIEIIYNQEFGQVPANFNPGVDVIACGDYITSNQQSGPYPPSPLDAILHWVHKAMNDRHENGFLMIDGQLYGQDDAPPRHGYGKFSGSSGE